MTPTPGFALLNETLCWKRVAAKEQAMRVLAKGGVQSRRVAKRILHALVGRGLIGVEEVPARPLLRLESPLVTWRPGCPRRSSARSPGLSRSGGRSRSGRPGCTSPAPPPSGPTGAA